MQGNSLSRGSVVACVMGGRMWTRWILGWALAASVLVVGGHEGLCKPSSQRRYLSGELVRSVCVSDKGHWRTFIARLIFLCRQGGPRQTSLRSGASVGESVEVRLQMTDCTHTRGVRSSMFAAPSRRVVG